MLTNEELFFPKPGEQPLKTRPVIVGSGPAGLFLRLVSSQSRLLSSGAGTGEKRQIKRMETVNQFWKNGVLDPESTVQFGEGGATFSDGKLNTLGKKILRKKPEVLKRFAEAGAGSGNPLSAEAPSWNGRTWVEWYCRNNERHEIEEMGGTFCTVPGCTDLDY